MGLGSTTKKIQLLADSAEKMYHRLNEVREQVETTQRTVDDTGERVKRLESEVAEQRAVLEAIATELDVDVAAVTAEAHITDAEDAAEESEAAGESDGDADSDGDAADESNADGDGETADENDAAGDTNPDDAGEGDRDDAN